MSTPLRSTLIIAAVLALAGWGCGATPPSSSGDGGTFDGGATDAGVDDATDGGFDAGTDGGEDCPPAPQEGTPLASNLPAVRRLAVDDTFVYATVSNDFSNNVGRVIRIRRAGGLVEDVAEGLTAPDAIAVDPQSGVPFVLDMGGVWRVDVGSKTRTRIDSAVTLAVSGESALVVDGDAVLIATGFRALQRAKLDGSGSQTLFLAPAGSVVRGVTLHGADAWFLVAQGPSPGIYRVPADGSSEAVRVRNEPVDGHALLIDGDTLVWSEGDSGDGRIVSAPLAGGPATVLASGLQHPFRIVRLGDAHYFKDTTRGPAVPEFLRRIDRCGVNAVGPKGVGPGDLVVKDGVMYFSSEDFTGQGFISRLP
ncbi:MAG: hypothetical protein IRZ16_00340 [Myxococcaceae bacterium]|nr:hypothetical protein [Myxococcaceae bacterium]